MDMNQYIDMFLDESREHLQAVHDNLQQLEKHPDETAIIAEIFRSAHTLKGMAAAMGYEEIALLTHQLENVLDSIRKTELPLTTAVIELTFSVLEALEEMVDIVGYGGNIKKDVSGLIAKLEKVGSEADSVQGEQVVRQDEKYRNAFSLEEHEHIAIQQAAKQGFSTYRLVIGLAEDCLLKAARVFMIMETLAAVGEVIKTVPGTEQLEQEAFDQSFALLLLTTASKDEVIAKVSKVSEVQEVKIDSFKLNEQQQRVFRNKTKSDGKQASAKTTRISTRHMDQLLNLAEKLAVKQKDVAAIASRLGDVDLIRAVDEMTDAAKEMQNMMGEMRMVPVKQVFNRFSRMVQTLAKDLGKEVELVISGADTKFDRSIIDKLGDPLVHLIRNALDHGIESPAVRSQQGKPATAMLALRAFQDGNFVYIEIEDDGRGMDRQKIIEKAVQNNILSLTDANQLTDGEVYELVFASGLSTAEHVSDVSGRGVGLDAVKSKIESLGGRVRLKTEKSKGSTFSIEIPYETAPFLQGEKELLPV